MLCKSKIKNIKLIFRSSDPNQKVGSDEPTEISKSEINTFNEAFGLWWNICVLRVIH